MKCPACGCDAYVGINVVECTNATCDNYVEPEEHDEFDKCDGCGERCNCDDTAPMFTMPDDDGWFGR